MSLHFLMPSIWFHIEELFKVWESLLIGHMTGGQSTKQEEELLRTLHLLSSQH